MKNRKNNHRADKMTVVIQQGKTKIVAMPGIYVGESEEENEKIAAAQREYFKNRPDMIIATMTQEEKEQMEEEFIGGLFE